MASIQFKTRSAGTEIMDDLNCSGEVVHQTLREIEFINQTLGGNSVSVHGVSQLLQIHTIKNPEILDLGCGGGGMLVLLKKKLRGRYPGIKLHGIDANPNIVQYATNHCSDDVVTFSATNILSDEFKKLHCDIALATLFFHHFTEDQLVEVIKNLKTQCRVGIVINDLHRHPLAYYSIKVLTQLFSKSSMVKFDAPLSVLRGFSKKELITILERAGIEKFTIQWRWAFRWKIIIDNG